MQVAAILLKPLDNQSVGDPRTFDKADFDRLESMGAVRRASNDEVVPPPPEDEQARLLAVLRDPVEGPKALDGVKATFEELSAELERARAGAAEANSLRDRLAAAEASTSEVDALRQQLADANAVADQLRAKLAEQHEKPEQPGASKPGRAQR